MDLMDIVVEVIFEILMEGYVSLMCMIVPEEKRSDKKIRKIVGGVAIAGVLAVMILLVAGLIMLDTVDHELGVILLLVAAALSVIQIVSGITVRVITRRMERKRSNH